MISEHERSQTELLAAMLAAADLRAEHERDLFAVRAAAGLRTPPSVTARGPTTQVAISHQPAAATGWDTV